MSFRNYHERLATAGQEYDALASWPLRDFQQGHEASFDIFHSHSLPSESEGNQDSHSARMSQPAWVHTVRLASASPLAPTGFPDRPRPSTRNPRPPAVGGTPAGQAAVIPCK